MGESTIEEGDYFGMPAIEAARLCAFAPDDGILAGELVRLMAARGDRDAFKSVGELDLKGIPEPVAAYEISWEPPGVEFSSVALPGALPQLAGDGLRRARACGSRSCGPKRGRALVAWC